MPPPPANTLPKKLPRPPSKTGTLPSPRRLPSLPTLRVKRPHASTSSPNTISPGSSNDANPCLTELSSLLNCWASTSTSSNNSGVGGVGCQELERALMRCADRPKHKAPSKDSINFHLGRLYPKIRGPVKKKGSLSTSS